MAVNNESVGISAEVAIAKSYDVAVNPAYEARAEKKIVELLMNKNSVVKIFELEGIPKPQKHIAEGQNPVDFILEGGKTLSVKTNQEGLGKVAPQKIGQPTAETYFTYLEHYFKEFSLRDTLKKNNLSDTYESRSAIFKSISMNNTADIVNMYWKNLFDCDFYLHFFHLDTYANPLNNYVVLGREQPPVWENDRFSFTQSLTNWNESNTLKYYGISIGEFQVHRNRNCFKFRFNMKGVMELISKGYV